MSNDSLRLISGRDVIFQYDPITQSLILPNFGPMRRAEVVADSAHAAAQYLFNHFHIHNLSYTTLFRYFVQNQLSIVETYLANKDRIMKSSRRLTITHAMNLFAPYQITLMQLHELMNQPGGMGHLEHINDLHFLADLAKKNPMKGRQRVAV